LWKTELVSIKLVIWVKARTVLPCGHSLEAIQERAVITKGGGSQEKERHQQVEPAQAWLFPPVDIILREAMVAYWHNAFHHLRGHLGFVVHVERSRL